MFGLFFLRYWPHLTVAAALIGGGLFLRSEWIEQGRNEVRAEWQEQKDKDAAAIAELRETIRKKEIKHAEELNAIDKNYQEVRLNDKLQTDHIIGDLRAGNARLRQRFTCPATSGGDKTNTGTSTGQRDAATQGGLQTADAEFFIRFADDADAVVRQLHACQSVIRADRGLVHE